MAVIGYQGFVTINSRINVIHNAFHNSIVALGQDVEGLAFDLHAWFKRSLRKEDYFTELSDFSELSTFRFNHYRRRVSFSAAYRQKMVGTMPDTGENSRKMGRC